MVEAEGTDSCGAERNKDESGGDLHCLLSVRCQWEENAILVFHWNSNLQESRLGCIFIICTTVHVQSVDIPNKFL